jgi:hypothetical protein
LSVSVLSPDFRRGRGMSRGKQSQAFMKALKREAEANGGENIFTEQQVCICVCSQHGWIFIFIVLLFLAFLY